MSPNRACLVCIDGWGLAPDAPGNAVTQAPTPVMDALARGSGAHTTLEASSLAVGLPEGLMGNSEVGHLNIGAGRVVWQDIVRIDQFVKNRAFGSVPAIRDSLQHAKSGSGRLHLLGLVSDGGVHSHINHLFHLLETVKEAAVPEVYVHFIGDGRDTDPKSSARYMQALVDRMTELGIGKVATIVGRYYAMDRDKRWERISVAVDALTKGTGDQATDPVEAIHVQYKAGVTDEFLRPVIFHGEAGRIKENDSIFVFNYRADRVREITQVLGVDASPLGDSYKQVPLHITTMTRYKADYPFPVAFLPQQMVDVLAEWLSKKGIAQRHVAETEKYAHVTFFFNGGVEKQFEGEGRDMVASPKVATYDLQPAMSVHGVAAKVAERLDEGKAPFVMCNLAPPDMVGHTGKLQEAISAVQATDAAIGTIYEACKRNNYALFVTADHGNAEKMLTEEGTPHTAHTTYPVPFIMAGAGKRRLADRPGVLGDVAPTILDYMGLDKPAAMDGTSLLA